MKIKDPMTSTSIYYIQMKQCPKTQGYIKILLRDGSGYRIQHIIININYSYLNGKISLCPPLKLHREHNVFLEESTPVLLCKMMKKTLSLKTDPVEAASV